MCFLCSSAPFFLCHHHWVLGNAEESFLQRSKRIGMPGLANFQFSVHGSDTIFLTRNIKQALTPR